MREVRIELSWFEVSKAGEVAVRRQLEAILKARREAHGCELDPDQTLDKNFRGALGEVATCSWLGTYWPGMGMKFGAVDARLAEVRAVGDADHRLVLHPKDRADLPWVSALVVWKDLPVVVLRGWCMGHDGMQQKYWSDPQHSGRHAFFVDNAELRPMEELLQFLEIAA